MRVPCVLFAFILLYGATPVYAALGDAPRCLLPPSLQGAPDLAGVNPSIPVLKPALADYDFEERDYLIRTMVFEASGEPEEGKAAVAHVILNRKKLGKWGDNIKEVVTRPWQFEPWMTRRSEMEKSKDDPRYRKAARIADNVLRGQEPTPPPAPLISSIRPSFGSGAADHCRVGREARDSRLAGIRSMRPKRVVRCRCKLFC